MSTEEQTSANQRPALERIARTRGLKIVRVYEEAASAAKHRPEYERAIADAKAGAFDVLLVWSLDRFGRSMTGNINDALALDRAGVELVSAREPWLDTAGPTRDLLLAIFSWVAEQERRRLIERTNAGIDRARAKGTRSGKAIGRPRRLCRAEIECALALRAEGRSVREIAMALRTLINLVERAAE